MWQMEGSDWSARGSIVGQMEGSDWSAGGLIVCKWKILIGQQVDLFSGK